MSRVQGWPKTPRKDQCCIVIDSREQDAWDFPEFTVERAGLQTGDYGLRDCPDSVCIERKSLADFIGSISGGRDRLEREIDRMRAFPVRAIVVEAAYPDLLNPANWRGRATPALAHASVASFWSRGCPVFFGHDKAGANRFAADLLWRVFQGHWRDCRQLAQQIHHVEPQKDR